MFTDKALKVAYGDGKIVEYPLWRDITCIPKYAKKNGVFKIYSPQTYRFTIRYVYTTGTYGNVTAFEGYYDCEDSIRPFNINTACKGLITPTHSKSGKVINESGFSASNLVDYMSPNSITIDDTRHPTLLSTDFDGTRHFEIELPYLYLGFLDKSDTKFENIKGLTIFNDSKNYSAFLLNNPYTGRNNMVANPNACVNGGSLAICDNSAYVPPIPDAEDVKDCFSEDDCFVSEDCYSADCDDFICYSPGYDDKANCKTSNLAVNCEPCFVNRGCPFYRLL